MRYPENPSTMLLPKGAGEVLNLTRLPARLTTEQTAALLGVEVHHIPILVQAGELKPLGRPAQSARKYYASVHIEECAKDTRWAERATRTLYAYSANHNKKRRAVQPDVVEEAQSFAD